MLDTNSLLYKPPWEAKKYRLHLRKTGHWSRLLSALLCTLLCSCHVVQIFMDNLVITYCLLFIVGIYYNNNNLNHSTNTTSYTDENNGNSGNIISRPTFNY